MSQLIALDHALFDWINTFHAAWLDTVMLTASHVGVGGGVWLTLAAISAVFPARRAAAWRVILTIALSSLVVNGVVKPFIWRDRPFKVLGDVRVIDAQPQSSSFPSGHAANAIAGAVATSQMLPGATVIWWLLGATIAISRIYVGVHFPLDVLSGSILGLMCAYFVLRDVKPHGERFAILPDTN